MAVIVAIGNRRRPSARSVVTPEDALWLQLIDARLPQPVREHRFHPDRRWRFDFSWPAKMLAVECEGAVWTNGRHTRGQGFTDDCEKYNAAALLGWKVLRFPSQQIRDGTALGLLRRVFSCLSESEIQCDGEGR